MIVGVLRRTGAGGAPLADMPRWASFPTDRRRPCAGVSMSDRRSLVINGKFLSAESTGVHRVAEELIRGLFEHVERDAALARRLEPKLWIPHDAQRNAERLGLPHRVVGPLRGIPWEQLTLPIRAHGHTVLSLCNVGPMMLRDAVTMFHDAQVHSSPASYSAGFRWWYRLHQPLAGHRHRRILTVSSYSRDELVRHGLAPADRIGVVRNGVDHVARLAADVAVLETLSLRPRGFVVALANTQAHKNIARLLQAFDAPDLADLTLVLFGAASRADFERQGHRVPPGVVFAGRVSDAQLRALYEAALCTAFPSLTEGFGLPPLEAMFLGCPAVVSPRGALPEVCGAGAVYVEPDDTRAWVNAIARLHRDRDLWESRRQAGTAHASAFTWSRAARVLLDELLLALR